MDQIVVFLVKAIVEGKIVQPGKYLFKIPRIVIFNLMRNDVRFRCNMPYIFNDPFEKRCEPLLIKQVKSAYQ